MLSEIMRIPCALGTTDASLFMIFDVFIDRRFFNPLQLLKDDETNNFLKF